VNAYGFRGSEGIVGVFAEASESAPRRHKTIARIPVLKPDSGLRGGTDYRAEAMSLAQIRSKPADRIDGNRSFARRAQSRPAR
jgi:hypothetical protein